MGLGLGAGVYFALPFEPGMAAGVGALIAGLAAAVVAIAGWQRPLLAMAAALLLGFGLAKWREQAVATPVLDHPAIAHLTGRVDSIEPRQTGVRLVLSDVRSGVFDVAPRRVRVALRSGGAGLHAGARVSLTASLSPPPAPVEPGAADFGRAAFFQSIGAVGFVYGYAHVIPALNPASPGERLLQGIENLRARMTARIHAALPGSTGAIAAALVTGQRGGISDEDESALRDAGLAHVLAIAGLHMALVGGGLFWLVRALLAAVPALALNWPIKKWAAAAALAASLFYLVISGAAAPAVRAFVMLAVALTAVMLDRPALTMRAVALAAALLLVWRPEAITQPGFQMSFAAVAALVAVAEWAAARPRGARHWLWRYVGGLAMTALVGSLATLPFALFHFGRATHYAVLGNLIAMPVMGLWVMPAAALSVLAMPFGWEAPALHLMGRGIDVMLLLGGWVAHLPGAVSLSPAMPQAALLAIVAGGLWLVIWRGRLRWLGLAGAAAGLALMLLTSRPDMLVAADGQTVAIRGADGLLHFVRPPQDKFAARMWLQRDGDARNLDQATGLADARCDGVGCVLPTGAGLVALPQRPEALGDDCTHARIVVTALSIPGGADRCKGPALVIDGRAAGEGWGIRFNPLVTQSVRQERGVRPWVPALNSGG
ncbi:MAG: ComEC/Rec2 family competence protein [Alphaproteobacteria bacterium]|nr:ComEC/Rec2 family competence protein [Alphaproteobacteria bacterium]